MTTATLLTPHPTPHPTPRPTPRPRDHAIDGIRALGTLAVIALHWLMVEATWDGATLVMGNALGHGPAWLLTWLNPLPILFLAAGAASGIELARWPSPPPSSPPPSSPPPLASPSSDLARGTSLLLRRLDSLVVPVAVLLAAVGVAALGLVLVGMPSGAIVKVALTIAQPLWFLGVYLVLTWLSPLLRRASTSPRGLLVTLLALGGGIVALDALRWETGITSWSLPTILFAWAVPYLLGMAYAQGHRLTRDREVLLGLFGTAALTTIALIAVGPYPLALIGMPGEAVSNLAPPTTPVLTFAVAQGALALLLRDRIAAWATTSLLATFATRHSMRLYLWHLPAMFAVAGTLMVGFDVALPAPWSGGWWLTIGCTLAAAALTLAVFVRGALWAEGQLDRRRRNASIRRSTVTPISAALPTTQPLFDRVRSW